MSTAVQPLLRRNVIEATRDSDPDDVALTRIRDLLGSLEADGASDTSPTHPAAAATPSTTGHSLRSAGNSPSSSLTSVEDHGKHTPILPEAAKPPLPKLSAALRLTLLPPGYSVTQLRILLGRFGAVKSCNVALDAATKTTTADVVFEAPEFATAALSVKPPLAVEGRAIGAFRVAEEIPLAPPPAPIRFEPSSLAQPLPAAFTAPPAAYAQAPYHAGTVTYVQYGYPSAAYAQHPAVAHAHVVPYDAFAPAYAQTAYAQGVPASAAVGYGTLVPHHHLHPYATPSAYPPHPATAYPATYQVASMAAPYPAGSVAPCLVAPTYTVPHYSPSVSLMPAYA